MKKIIIITMSIIIFCAVGFACYFAGNVVGSKKIVHSSDSIKKSANDNTEQYIAVVNLDEGTVLSNNETIYYGEQVIRFSDESFLYTSLEDARRGIENDSYGAYIIIPSTFSQSIDSLNSSPTQSIFKYALNTNFDGEKQKEILYKVLSFGEDLKNDISYMYLANILQEFHEAQDYTSAVMDNDLKEKNIIEEIQASDLVEMVIIPETEKEENNLTALDITDFMSNNNALVKNIDEEYKGDIDDSMEQLTNLNNSGKTLSQALTNLTAKVGEIKLQTDDKGNVVYEKGIQSFSQSLTDFNTKLQLSKSDILSETDTLEEQRNYIATALKDSIEKYNNQLKAEMKELLSNHKQDLSESLPALTCAIVDDSNGKQIKITSNSIEGEEAPSLLVSIVSDDSDVIAKRKECLDTILNKLLEAKEETETIEVTLEGKTSESDEENAEEETKEEETKEEETKEEETKEENVEEKATGEETKEEETVEENVTGEKTTKEDTEEESTQEEDKSAEEETGSESVISLSGSVEVNKSVATAFAACDSDADILQLLNECGYNSALDFIGDITKGSISLEPITYLKIDGNISELESYVKSGMDFVKEDVYQITEFSGNTFDESGNSRMDENCNPITASNLLENYSVQIQDIKPEISAIEEIDSQFVKEIVNNSCILPLIERTEKIKKIFEQRYLDEMTDVAAYQNLLAAYNPIKDTSKIDDYVSQMETNGYAMQESVRENNQDYIEFTEKVYTSTDENLTILKTHIEEAEETSKNMVSNGLAEAKALKESTSKENQLMMSEFAAKLPYTRLGTMEYTQAYEFIASPLKLMQVSNYQKLKDNVTILADSEAEQDTTKKQSSKKEIYVRGFLYILLVFMIVILFVNVILQKKRNKKIVPNT
ncbi:hypothetical protein C8E03_106212 [Lachnotalea glycerini]|uniref:Type VII secretion protein EsaA n=1 Tax=Lachnotalea glycerini TaxID=1763509 RepID=A0A318EQW1_9FIRM|nr:hypothetical protein [Lachnotalea glycerini]PXV89560.1 hypothetical protein C8E03_106212 [Lachnotalea glycerini]